MQNKRHTFFFSAYVDAAYQEEVERVFFFNERQNLYFEQINHAVAQFGIPCITKSSQGLFITLPNIPETQCLFALTTADQQLAGVASYILNEENELEILHLATAHHTGVLGCSSTQAILFELIRIAKMIKGVVGLRLPYGRGSIKIGNAGTLQ